MQQHQHDAVPCNCGQHILDNGASNAAFIPTGSARHNKNTLMASDFKSVSDINSMQKPAYPQSIVHKSAVTSLNLFGKM